MQYLGTITKVGSQEIPGVTGKFGLGVQNESGQRLIEFCQENTLVTVNTIFQQYMNHKLPDVQAGFRKGRGTRHQIASIRWLI